MGQKTGFNVAGVTFENEAGWKHNQTTLKRLVIISQYVKRGTRFKAVREPDHPDSAYAIRIDAVFKSGKSVDIGYIPEKDGLSKRLSAVIDTGLNVDLSFGRRHINKDTGDCMGLMLRYEVIEC